MKRGWMIALLLMVLLLSGCAPAEKIAEPPVITLIPDGQVQLAAQPSVDLTLLSNTMAYAELFNMSMNTGRYLGQTVRLEGQYYAARLEESGEVVHLLMVSDQQACCSIGVEFKITGSHRYPEDFPAHYSTIELTGLFGSIRVGDSTYPLLTVNEIRLISPPPSAD